MKKLIYAVVVMAAMKSNYVLAVDNQFLLEIDPLTFVQKGYSLHIALGAGTYALDLPQPLVELNHNNKGWEDRINNAYVIFFDYLFDEKIEGWTIGGEITSQEHKVSIAGETTEFKSLAYLARVGYHFVLFRSSLYFYPWLGIGSTHLTSGTAVLPISGKTFDYSNVAAFATLHVGWRF